MKLKLLAAMVFIFADLVLFSHSANAQTVQINKPAGQTPELNLNLVQVETPFSLLIENCDHKNDAKACFMVGKNYVLAAGGFSVYKGIQEKIVRELEKVAKEEHAAIASLESERNTDSETLAQMQSWETQVQNLADTIHTGMQKYELNAQWGLWFLNRGCKLGSDDACTDLSLALLYRDGESTEFGGLHKLEMYCQKGIGSACKYLGDFYHKGEYFPKSAENAAKYYELGCGAKEHDLDACVSIAKLYETGNGVMKDPAKAKEVYRFICMRNGTHCGDEDRLKKVVDETEAPIFDLGKKLFPELYKDLTKE